MFTQDIVDISGSGKFPAADTLHDNLQGIPHFALHVDRNPVFQVVRPQELRSVFRNIMHYLHVDTGTSLVPRIGQPFLFASREKSDSQQSPPHSFVHVFFCHNLNFFVVSISSFISSRYCSR